MNQSKIRKDHDEWHDVADPLFINYRNSPELSQVANIPVPEIHDSPDSEQLADICWINSTSNHCHLLEFLDGSAGLGGIISELGWNVGAPIDLKNGHKLNNHQSLEKAYRCFETKNPFLVAFSFLNFQSTWNNNKRVSRRQRNIVQFCSWIIEEQLRQSKLFLIFVTPDQAYTPEFGSLQSIADQHCNLDLWHEVYVQSPDCDPYLSHYMFSNLPRQSMQCFQSNTFYTQFASTCCLPTTFSQ